MGLVQIQPQGDGKGDDGLLGGAVVLVALDLGEGALVHVGALVALHVGHAALVDEGEQHLLKAHVQLSEVVFEGTSLRLWLSRLGSRRLGSGRFGSVGSPPHGGAGKKPTAVSIRFSILGAISIVVVLAVPDHVVVVDEGADIVEELLAEGVGLFIEHADVDGQLMLEQKFGDGLHRELQHLILGKAVHPRADEGKGHRLAVVLHGQFEGFDVAGAEDSALSVGAAMPHGAGGVDDVLAGEIVPARDLGLP